MSNLGYSMINYTDWIENYIHRLATQEHYGVTATEKETWVEKLRHLLNQLKSRLYVSNKPIL